MSRKRLAILCVPLFIAGATLSSPSGPVLAGPPVSNQAETPETATKLSEAFSALHAVNQAATNFSNMAEKRAKSDLVKNYASAIAKANPIADEKLLHVAKQDGINVVPLDPKTEKGKSLLDRINAEAVLLGSLEGDAWDKEYMILVTNAQQSVIRLLKKQRTLAKNKDVKQYLGELITTVEKRLNTSQDIMAKIYGDEI